VAPFVSLRLLPFQESTYEAPEQWQSDSRIQEIIHLPNIEANKVSRYRLEEWIKQQSGLTDAEKALQPRPRAALISLVRNEELDGILQSMKQLEHNWNHRYNYPWIFFSEKPFSEAFKVKGTAKGRYTL
jgi:Glycolipid 2-alpha-mannosyltransferase